MKRINLPKLATRSWLIALAVAAVLTSGIAGPVDGQDEADDSTPWGELGDDVDGTIRWNGTYISLLPGTAGIWEEIHGENNTLEDGSTGGVFYGEGGKETTEQGRWAQLMLDIVQESEHSPTGRGNFAYAYAGPGWTTTVEARGALIHVGSGDLPATIYRGAGCFKVLNLSAGPESVEWGVSFSSSIHLSAGCTASLTPLDDLSVALAAGQLKVEAADSTGIKVFVKRAAAVCYSDDWFEREQKEGDGHISYVSVSESDTGERSVIVHIGGEAVVAASMEESTRDELGAHVEAGVAGIDEFVRTTAPLKGAWKSVDNTAMFTFYTWGSVNLERDTIGEWTNAHATQRKNRSAYVERKLIRIEMERFEDGEWVLVDMGYFEGSDWVSSSSVPTSGPQESREPEEKTRNIRRKEHERKGGTPGSFSDAISRIRYEDADTGDVIEEIVRPSWDGAGEEYLDEDDVYENVRLVRIYQKERNKEFLEDGFWKVTVKCLDTSYNPPLIYRGIDQVLYQ
ncbi:MAG: hypothetical protein KDB68_13515 [Planctomycetes bacterium]|nr:hypothetical protein [Planctomycetota bacterium]